MTPPPGRFGAAVERFDQANREDPTTEVVAGVAHPGALLYGRRMSATLEALAPDASEAVRLAVRCQHIRRWEIPRRSYPEGRDGYRRWRTDLARFHAETAAAILREVGYDDALIRRVESLLRKERLKLDPEVQLLEDVACLVFLTHGLADFLAQHPAPQVVDVLRKTWRKMSDTGRAAALRLPLDEPARALLAAALAPSDGGGAPSDDGE